MPDDGGALTGVGRVREQGSQSIHRALGILRCFTPERPAATLRELCAATGLTSPTAHRMVKALQSNGFLVRTAGGSRYTIGPAVLELANLALTRGDHAELVAATWPHLELLRERTGETVGLHVRLDADRLCLAELQSPHAVRMARGVGHVTPLHAGASGKALLAWLPPRQRRSVLPDVLHALTPATIVDHPRLDEELQAVRRRGYATSLGEVVADAAALAVPLFGPGGVVRAVVNVTGPAARWTPRRMASEADAIVAAVSRIELNAGYPTGRRGDAAPSA